MRNDSPFRSICAVAQYKTITAQEKSSERKLPYRGSVKAAMMDVIQKYCLNLRALLHQFDEVEAIVWWYVIKCLFHSVLSREIELGE